MRTPPARGSHALANRIRSLALTSGASIFRTINPDRINDLAQKLANGHPYTNLTDEELRSAILNVKDKTYFVPKNEIEETARGQRFERVEVSTIGEAVKQMTPAERLDHVHAKSMPSRFVIAPKIIVKDIEAALACCTPQQRIQWNETYQLPSNIVVAERETDYV